MMRRRRKQRNQFEQVALPHLDALYGAAYRLTRNARDAEDLVQDAMLRAYRFWDSFQHDSNCKAWLFKILTNTFINNYQKAKRSREIIHAAAFEQEAVDGVLVHEHSASQRDPRGVLLDKTMSQEVADALASIPTEFRMAVVLCDVEGFSYKEIAEIMDCPVGTVMSRLYRGRRLLKKALHDFALEKGIVRPGWEAQADGPADTPADTNDAPANIIDLDSRRNR
jgi:RNA polymerase sigma-70 factor (ECF subfamily)